MIKTLRMTFASLTFLFDRHLREKQRSVLSCPYRMELWANKASNNEQKRIKRSEYEILRFVKWPPCCDPKGLSDLITILVCFILEIVLSFREKQNFRFDFHSRFNESEMGWTSTISIRLACQTYQAQKYYNQTNLLHDSSLSRKAPFEENMFNLII